jgi:hypothetical protein
MRKGEKFCVSDPVTIRPVDPYPDLDSVSGSGSRRAKMNRKKSKKFSNFIF